MSTNRIDFRDLSKPAYDRLLSVKAQAERSGLGKDLLELVYLRASQINGCAFCTDLHYRVSLDLGVDARKLNSVVVWRESRFFNEAERAALEWSEIVTRINEAHGTMANINRLREHFSDAQVCDLTVAIAAMNAINRMAIAFEEPQQE